ncbi:unnamed protein product [Prunus armeniaca]
MMLEGKDRVPLWQGLYLVVYKDDLKDLLTKDAVTDSFAKILQTERSNDPAVRTKSHMMTTFWWVTV